MNKRGFTLIELLAVILILGVIALIAIPQVTTVINTSSRKAQETSAKHYISAVNNKIALNQLDSNSSNDIKDGLVDIQDLDIDMSGKKPTSGSLLVKNNAVLEAELEIGDKKVICNSGNECIAYDGYIYYNKSTLAIRNGIPISFIVSKPEKDTWLYEKPSTGTYARYKLINGEIVGNADVCSAEADICLSVDNYELSVERTLRYFNFDKSTWTYSGKRTGTYNKVDHQIIINYETWTRSNDKCEFGNTGLDSEELFCYTPSTFSLRSRKDDVYVLSNGSTCHYIISSGISCASE